MASWIGHTAENASCTGNFVALETVHILLPYKKIAAWRLATFLPLYSLKPAQFAC
jgi:hypothetical protein